MSIWDAIGAVTGLFGASSQDSANRSANRLAREQFAYQQELNRSQVQWRVADAQKAGIHPLYALGPTGATFSPVSGSTDTGGSLWAQAGQDLSRAATSMMSARERRTAAHAAMVRQQMEDDITLQRHQQDMARGSLEMELLRSQIARMNSAQVGPGAPVDASNVGNVDPLTEFQPSRPVVSRPGVPGQEPGPITDYRYVTTHDGSLVLAPSTEMSQMVDEFGSSQGLGWWWRNNLLPLFGGRNRPAYPDSRHHPAGRGMEWVWSGTQWERKPIRRARGRFTGNVPRRAGGY